MPMKWCGSTDRGCDGWTGTAGRALARVVNEVSDEVVGLGPIEFLLRDPDVTEVMVNGADDVYVERRGPLLDHRVDCR